MSEGKQSRRHAIADAGRSARIHRVIRRVEAEARHQGIKNGRDARRKEVGPGAVRRKADGRLLIDERPLPRRASQSAADTGAEREAVVCGPRVEDAGVGDRECPRHHGRTEL